MVSPRPCAGADTDSLPWLAEHCCREGAAPARAYTCRRYRLARWELLSVPLVPFSRPTSLKRRSGTGEIMSIIDSMRRTPLLGFTAVVIAVMGLALAAGGTWLAALGGSFYYL